ncbi:hypothetical protein J2850_002955 [Azospirillum picis]|uniref:Uncharacterized protein n=1 Tax=Azospirillum picis TaxID=488438 RepID=A0ABU0MKZ2_9PROT|nr:hypothetical protein [Azospirillum picis]MDQ0533909.1 hypothetical protein [Azospirillum picis]
MALKGKHVNLVIPSSLLLGDNEAGSPERLPLPTP